MMALVQSLSYLMIATFVAAVIWRVVRYLRFPVHLRWELYPVAHEGARAAYGGSYLEDVDWWKKPRKSSLLGELKVMVPEILFLKALWEHNRPLWYWSYPFHLGLYLIAAFVAMVVLGAALELTGVPVGPGTALGSLVAALTNLLGPLGFIMGLLGSAGLLVRRLTSRELREYSSFSHYFNLLAFIAALAAAIATWLLVDPNFAHARGFAVSLLSFRPMPDPGRLFTIQMVLALLLLAYIPLTHMSHFFMKYFLYHDIRWGDEPNMPGSKLDREMTEALSYPVSWAAPHIAGDGRKTWVDVATFNPAQDKEEKTDRGEPSP